MNRHRLIIALTAGLAMLSLGAGICPAATYKTITIDGDITDWAGVTPILVDPAGDGGANGFGQTVDYREVYIANDDDYLYFRFDLEALADPTNYFSNYHLNTDGQAGTGYSPPGNPIGAEVTIQNTTAFQVANGAFTEGSLAAGNSGVQVAQFGVSGTTGWEYRISLDSLFEYSSAGQPIFSSPTISLMFESQNASFQPADVAGPISYTIAIPEPATTIMLLPGLLLARRRRT